MPEKWLFVKTNVKIYMVHDFMTLIQQ